MWLDELLHPLQEIESPAWREPAEQAIVAAGDEKGRIGFWTSEYTVFMPGAYPGAIQAERFYYCDSYVAAHRCPQRQPTLRGIIFA